MACLWHLSVLVFDNKSLISGVILDTSLSDYPSGQKNTTAKILKTYFRKPLTGKNVVIHVGTERYHSITDDHGSFSISLDRQVGDEVKIFLTDNSLNLRPIQKYPHYFGPNNGILDVISDIDDTVIVSHTVSLIKRIKTLFTPVHKRKKIDFTYGLISNLMKANGRIFYVSKSESNLFEMLSSFIKEHGLPIGQLYLTPYLKFLQLLNPKKGKTFKLEHIKSIIDLSGDKYFVLIGDDTQKDMDVYYEIAKLYPNRILKIYIRKTRKKLLRSKQNLMVQLQDQQIPFRYYLDADDFLEEVDLIYELIPSVK